MNKFIKKHWSLVLFIAFLLLGFYLRASGVFTNSFAFTYDVGRDMLEVQKIFQNFDIPLIGQTTGLGGLFYGPWWYYILTPPFIISNGNPQGIAFFMVFTGILTIIAGYIFGKKVQGVMLGIIIAAFISVSSALVALSNQIWNPNMIPLLLLLLFLCIFFPVKNKKKDVLRNFSIGFLLGIILDCEIVFGVLLGGGVALSYLFHERKKFFSKEKLYILIGFFITFLPRIIFEIRHNFIMTSSLFKPKEESQQIFDFLNFFNVLPERVTVFVSQIGDTFGLNYILALLLCLSVVIFWIIFRKKQTKIEKHIFYSLVIMLGVFLVGSSFFARAVWGHYLVGLPIIYILLLSLVLILIVRKSKILGISISLILIFLSLRPDVLLSNFQNPHWEGNAAVYRNQVAVIDYIYKDAKGKKFNYIAYTPVVHDYTYQYLFSWYAKNKYGYSPAEDAQNVFYVIIEPDPGYEGRITDWLKIREGDGQVIDEDLVKGGIRVQRRER